MWANCKYGEKIAADQALPRLRDVESDCCANKHSCSEDPSGNNKSKSAVESDEKPIVSDSSDKDTDHVFTDLEGNDDGVQNLLRWLFMAKIVHCSNVKKILRTTKCCKRQA